MKRFDICIFALACVMAFAGCKNAAGEAVRPSADAGYGSERPAALSETDSSRSAQAAYAAFLSGDISLFDAADTYKWGLDAWTDTILPAGELEYTCLDLDGDGAAELLIQWADDPSSYNGVFHYDGGRLFCWQNDYSEGNCRDYPLRDGTMVRQYDFNGACSYTVFCYRSDGEVQELMRLFAREEAAAPNSSDPCPYYEVDGSEVDKAAFDGQLQELITGRRLDRSVWTRI